MMNRLQAMAVPILATLAGFLLTLGIAAAVRPRHQELQEARRKYAELTSSEARRVELTWDQIEASDQRRKIEEIHQAAQQNPHLAEQLTRLYDWWLTCSDGVQADLLDVPEQEWSEEVRRRYEESLAGNFITIKMEKGSRRVPRERVNQFVEAVCPVDDLSDDERQLLDEVDDIDRPLAQLLLTVRYLFPAEAKRTQRGPQRMPAHDSEQLQRTYQAIVELLLQKTLSNSSARDAQRETMRSVIVSMRVIRALMGELVREFHQRHQPDPDLIAEEFLEYRSAEQAALMRTDPQESIGRLQAQATASDNPTSSARLVVLLKEYDHRVRSLARWAGGRGRGRGGPDGRRGPDERRRHPPEHPPELRFGGRGGPPGDHDPPHDDGDFGPPERGRRGRGGPNGPRPQRRGFGLPPGE